MPQPEYLTYPRHIAEVWERYATETRLTLRLSGLERKRANGIRAQLYRYRKLLQAAAYDGDDNASELYRKCEPAVVDVEDAGGDGFAVVIRPHPVIAALAASKESKPCNKEGLTNKEAYALLDKAERLLKGDKS